jgi:Right handed beta helix region
MNSKNGTGTRRGAVILLALGALVALPALALGHVERASYWPDPGPDTSVNPPAGGAVPAVRPLDTALDDSQPGTTRVVCKGSSVPAPTLKNVAKLRKQRKAAAKKGNRVMVRWLRKKIKKANRSNAAKLAAWERALKQNPSMQALDASLADAVAHGYVLRSSQPRVAVSQAEADRIHDLNAQLLARCSYDSIQAAVTDSGNNDRVEIMPGVYTEPQSRAAPTHDPACQDYVETNDHGATGALSYKYQFLCPNDQNLIAVMGRGLTAVAPPQPPAVDRHGIPDAGPCIRCNLQIQGTGVSPDDVVIDGGDPSLGDKGTPGPNPADYAKDNGFRGDRADGLVIANLKVRHFNENGIYVTESDGWHLDRFKAAYNKEYGQLSFVGDHALIENCDAWGSGDAALYPGATADVGDAVPPDQRRYGTELRNCDMHHSAAGYSATDGNAIWIHDNEFYDNTLGLTTDVFTAPGHPGFPADSQLIENNNFHSNNFNLYLPICGPGEKPGPHGPNQGCSDVVPTVPEPVGTGLWVAGGNHMIIRNNHFWDNWRRGIMIFAVPDQLVCGPAGIDPSLLAGCDPTKLPPSTSYNNRVHGNVMGRGPDGSVARNGKDFWWDEFAGNTGNCWFDNTGPNGDRASLTADPPLAPVAGQSLPAFLPENCDTSLGTAVSGAPKEAELLGCFAAITFDSESCPWFSTPAKP